MAILSLQLDYVGQVGLVPRRGKMLSTDTLTVITTAGYLNGANLQGIILQPTDILDVIYGYVSPQSPGTFVQLVVSISAGVITLSGAEGTVILPVVAGHFANFSGTAGAIADLGFVPSNATKTNVVMANGASIVNHIAIYADSEGTISEDAATAINGGNIQAGLSGTAGTLASFPSTVAKGSLNVAAVANTGNTATTISNVAMGQASVISIPDPAGATANFALAPSALVSGNLVKASGTAGLLVDQGVAFKSVAQVAVAGGAAAQTVTDAFCTTGSMVTASWNDTSNAVTIQKVAAGNGSFVVTSSADPGASHLNYIITK